jgi:dTDP-L-rhamnose 4-epimerase
MKVLVTGGAGFIGSHVIDLLIEKGYAVRVLDALVPQVHGSEQNRPSYFNQRAELHVGRVEDPVAITKALDGIESVIHLAAAVGVGQSMYEIVDYSMTNVIGTAALLQALVDRKQTLQSFTVASSMSVYGEGMYRTNRGELVAPKVRREEQLARGEWDHRDASGQLTHPIPTPEEKPLNPISVYAVHKRDQEEMCLSVGAAYGMPTTALRLFNVYGTRQALSNPYTGVAAIFCGRLLNDRPPLVFEDGHQQRDFVHVRDVARAFVAAAECPIPGEIFNIGSGEAISVLEIAEILTKELKKDIQPQVLGRYRKGDIRHCVADISKARRLLQWQPNISFHHGVLELIEWVRVQREAQDGVDHAWTQLERRGLLV